MAGIGIIVWTDKELTLLAGISKKWLVFFLVLLAYPFLQVVPMPRCWVDLVSPIRNAWVERMAEATSSTVYFSATSYSPLTTLFCGFWWLFLFMYGLFLRYELKKGESHKWLFHILFSMAALQALHGLLQVLVPSLGAISEYGITGEYARGAFVNRNHFAAFLGMIWPLLLAQLAATTTHLKESRPNSMSARELLVQKKWFFAIITGMILLSLLFSGSRGGIVSSLLALGVLFSLGRRQGCRELIMLAGVCCLVAIMYGGIIGFDPILTRFAGLKSNPLDRWDIWKDTMRVITSHPLTGSGLGTFPQIVRLYQTHLVDTLNIGHAHNDYLELAAEIGIPLAVIIIGVAWVKWWQAASKIREYYLRSGSQRAGFRSYHRSDSIIAVGALAGIAAFLCHCIVDSNWRIPANQVYFIVLSMLLNINSGSRSGATNAQPTC